MSMLRRLGWVSTASLALLGFAAACAPAAAPTAPPGPPAGAKPGGSLKIGAERDITTLDPYLVTVGWDIYIMQNTYSGLLRAGTDLQPVPDLALKWEFKDPKTLEFKLRQGVKFHNGREVVADDVKYSVERIQDPKVPHPRKALVGSVERVETPDKYTVVFKLSRPDAAVVNNTTMPNVAIVPKEAVEQGDGLANTMVGSGPFKFKEWVPKQKLVLIKNPDYYEKGLPLLDELVLIPLLDETARTNALRSGDIDYVEPAPPKDIAALRADRNIVVAGGPNLSFVGMSLNTSKAPYDKVEVRQAFAYGIDRKEVVDKGFDGFAQPLWGPPLTPPYWAGNTDQYYKLDREKAKQLLTAAGHPSGFKTNIQTGTGTSYHAPFAAVLQSELKKIGVELEIIAQDGAVSNKNWREGNFEIYPIRWWGADFIDPDGAFRDIFTCKGAYNNSRYCDAKFDEALDKGLGVTKLEERKAAYRDAMKVLADGQPWTFLVNFDRFQAMRAYVKGYTSYPNGSHYGYREIWLDK